MSRKIIFSLLLICLGTYSIYAQDILVKGVVTAAEDGQPISGMNINVVGESVGAVTDFNGNYSINVPAGGVLQFSYIGFKTQIVPVKGNTLNISMKVDSQALDEVVVIGYGTQSRSEVTAAVGKVKNEDLDQIAVGTAEEALVGQIAGLNIQATESEAGSESTVTIRGVGSIAGNSNPLLVIDGVPLEFSFLNSVDVNDIQSVEVLKDAASASIYGSRAAGGVIIITTKEGKEGETKFSYSTFSGIIDAFQSEDYDTSVAEWSAIEEAALGELSSRSIYRNLIGVDESWQDRIFDGGTIESHSLTARGGSKRTKFSTGLSYLHDEGVLVTDDFKKYNFKLKIDTQVSDKFKFGASLNPSFTNRRRFDGSVHDILRQQPWLPTFHDANTIRFVDRNAFPDVQIGDYAVERHFDNFDLFGDGSELVDISSTGNTNPFAKVAERNNKINEFRVYGKFYGQYKIAKGLTARFSLGGQYSNRRRRIYDGVEASRNGAADAALELETRNRVRILSEGILSYTTNIGSNDFDFVLGASAEKEDIDFEEVVGIGFQNDLLQTLSNATIISDFTSYRIQDRLISYFGRGNWSYDNKYLASLSVRADGSSVFGANNKYGFFPAASFGWNIAREDFLSESDFVNDLKFRASYGFTGNNNLNVGAVRSAYPSLQLFDGSTFIDENNTITPGQEALNIANPDLQWERSREVNLGVDFGFFNNVITGAVDVYNKTSDELLLDKPLSTTTGFGTVLQNIGKVENRGIELELRTRNIATQNFRWTSTILGSINENELLDFGGASGLITSVDGVRPAEWINLVGEPISSFYGFVVDREIPLEFINDPFRLVGGQAQDVYVKDLNGDGVIDGDDRTILGDPYPDLIWSIANDFRYKNFDASFTFQGSWGAQVRNITDQYIFNHFNSSQSFIPETTPDQEFIRQKIFTDDIIQDASFVSLRTVNIGYTLDEDVTSRIGLNNLRIYVSAQNLLFITADGYSAWNPEALRNEGVLNNGYQRGGSPVARTISLGLNVEF